MQKSEDGSTYRMSRIDLIKFLRECTELGLKDAKDKVDDCLLMDDLTYEDRQAIYTIQRLISRGAYPQNMKGIIKRKLGIE